MVRSRFTCLEDDASCDVSTLSSTTVACVPLVADLSVERSLVRLPPDASALRLRITPVSTNQQNIRDLIICMLISKLGQENSTLTSS